MAIFMLTTNKNDQSVRAGRLSYECIELFAFAVDWCVFLTVAENVRTACREDVRLYECKRLAVFRNVEHDVFSGCTPTAIALEHV